MTTNFDLDKFYVIAGTSTWELSRCLTLLDIYLPDENQKFFKDIMAYSPKALSEDLMNAICFFKKQFGIDFSNQIQFKSNQWCINGATLTSFILNPDLQLELVLMDTGKTTACVFSGGWMVLITEAGFLGSINGQQIYYKPNSIFIFGYIKVQFPDNTTKFFHYRSIDPISLTTNTFTSTVPINLAICDIDTKIWGNSIGLITATKIQPCLYQLSLRDVHNFSTFTPTCR